MNEQAKLLTEIDSLCFALTDLNLYLDINDNDKDIINLYNQYTKKKEILLNQYQSKYGPITLNCEIKYPWNWNDSPWPWEN
jgi:spore coat protein JB